MKVLLVENDPISRELIEELLSRLGHKVVAVGSGGEGLAKLNAEAWDAVIMDMILPGISGFDVLRMMKSRPNKVVVITALSPGEVKDVSELPFVKLLYKPFTMEELSKEMETPPG